MRESGGEAIVGMKVKYLGESSVLELLHGKVYNVEAIDPSGKLIEIIDETNEAYVYPLSRFEIVEE